MIFKVSSLKNQGGRTDFFLSILNLIFTACVAWKIQFEIDKKSSSSNWIFLTRDFKNQVEMDRGLASI